MCVPTGYGKSLCYYKSEPITKSPYYIKGSLAEPDPLPDRYAGKGSGQLTIPISFCKLHVAWEC